MQAMRAVEVPEYDFVTHQRSARTQRVEPADVVIIEGILVLHEPTVCGMLNMKIFVDTDDDVRLARR
jgi:uridine kinase